jgi:hypothetical protein
MHCTIDHECKDYEFKKVKNVTAIRESGANGWDGVVDIKFLEVNTWAGNHWMNTSLWWQPRQRRRRLENTLYASHLQGVS